MREFPKGGLVGKVYHTVKWAARFRVGLYAAHACYFIVLSLFPSLILILGLLRNAGLSAESLISVLEGFVPEILFPAVQKTIRAAYHNTTGTVLSISAIGALWSASRGIYGLLTGLNRIYDVAESRGYWFTRFISMLYTFGFLVVLVLTLVLGVFGNSILSMLPPAKDPLGIFLSEIIDLRVLLMLFLQTALFTAMFMVLPNRRNGFRESFPGAVLACIGWMVFTRLFSFYVEHFSSYSNIYGSVYAVALSMLWLYCCLSIVFYGGALNKLLMEPKE